jgi:O-antigen ligase
MVSCLLLGGGTTTGLLSDAVLQLLAVPLLVISLFRIRGSQSQPPRWALLFCLAVCLVPLLQLVPLPPSVWEMLPGRGREVAAFKLLDRDPPWMPVSVSPQATWLSALSLIPPVAVFLGTTLLDYRHRRLLTLVVLVFGVLSVFVGLAQVAQGPNSALRFFEITNVSEAVGFFANRNHFAAFLYVLTLFAAAFAVDAAAGPATLHSRFGARRIVPIIASFTVLVMLVAAEVTARSRAGLGLTIVALLGCMALAASDRRTATGITPSRLLASAALLAVMFGVQFTLYRVMERFSDDPLGDSRIIFARLTVQAAKRYMPFGSGMGTFVPVYTTFAKPDDALLDTYVNRAHNDLLEISLEAGAAGLALMAIFVAWLVGSALRVWRRDTSEREIDIALTRAATIALGLMIAHSFLDYPLRTAALMAVLAFACALLVPPARLRREYRGGKHEWVRATATPKPARVPPEAAVDRPVTIPQSQQPGGRWGENIDWPEEWRRKQ